MVSELEEKTLRLQRVIRDENLGGILLNAQHNFAWLTCGRSNGIDVTRENGSSYLFVGRNGKRYLIANNIEMPRLLDEEISADDFEPVQVSWQAEKDGRTVLERARSLTTAAKIASDIPLFAGVKAIEPAIASCRYELTPPEIERYRELGRDAGETLGNVISKIGPGQTENEIAGMVRSELSTHSIFSVVTFVGADERIAEYRHPVPTDNKWTDTLLIAVCARRHGLIASLSRIVCVGEIPPELRRRTEAAAAINAAVYEATSVAISGAEIYRVAADAYAKEGFADEIDKHHQGGATGYRTRDWVVHPTQTEIVRRDQAFAWNPSITGTKCEETAILTDDGLEVITATDGFPVISASRSGREYFSPGILSLSKGVSA